MLRVVLAALVYIVTFLGWKIIGNPLGLPLGPIILELPLGLWVAVIMLSWLLSSLFEHDSTSQHTHRSSSPGRDTWHNPTYDSHHYGSIGNPHHDDTPDYDSGGSNDGDGDGGE